MTITFNIWVLLFGCGLAIGVFLQFLFLFFRKKHSLHFKNVIAAFFIMSIMLLDEIIQESDVIDYYPFLADFTLTADLLIWPFFLFYIQAISGKRSRYSYLDMVYFLPFLIGFIWQIPYTFSQGLEKIEYFEKGIPQSMAIFVLFKSSIAFLFLGYTIHTLTVRLSKLKELFYGNKKVILLCNFRKLVIAISVVIFLVYATFFFNYFDFHIPFESDKVGSLLIIGMFYFMGIIAFKNPALFEENSYSSLIVDFFNGEEASHANRLFTFFQTERPYLNEKLTLGETAQNLGLSNQQLSYLINQYLGTTFLDFVNTYRVGAVKQALKNGEHKKKTLLGLALESGFGNKASFNRIFKNHEGISPSTYAEKKIK
ncbi:MAG: helix-turn-helix domain-containing protein [Ekhidna sp.]